MHARAIVARQAMKGFMEAMAALNVGSERFKSVHIDGAAGMGDAPGEDGASGEGDAPGDHDAPGGEEDAPVEEDAPAAGGDAPVRRRNPKAMAVGLAALRPVSQPVRTRWAWPRMFSRTNHRHTGDRNVFVFCLRAAAPIVHRPTRRGDGSATKWGLMGPTKQHLEQLADKANHPASLADMTKGVIRKGQAKGLMEGHKDMLLFDTTRAGILNKDSYKQELRTAVDQTTLQKTSQNNVVYLRSEEERRPYALTFGEDGEIATPTKVGLPDKLDTDEATDITTGTHELLVVGQGGRQAGMSTAQFERHPSLSGRGRCHAV